MDFRLWRIEIITFKNRYASCAHARIALIRTQSRNCKQRQRAEERLTSTDAERSRGASFAREIGPKRLFEGRI